MIKDLHSLSVPYQVNNMSNNNALETAILCVDDEPIVTQSLRSLFYKSLKEVGVIEVAHSAEEAMEVIEEFIADGIELQVGDLRLYHAWHQGG